MVHPITLQVLRPLSKGFLWALYQKDTRATSKRSRKDSTWHASVIGRETSHAYLIWMRSKTPTHWQYMLIWPKCGMSFARCRLKQTMQKHAKNTWIFRETEESFSHFTAAILCELPTDQNCRDFFFSIIIFLKLLWTKRNQQTVMFKVCWHQKKCKWVFCPFHTWNSFPRLMPIYMKNHDSRAFLDWKTATPGREHTQQIDKWLGVTCTVIKLSMYDVIHCKVLHSSRFQQLVFKQVRKVCSSLVNLQPEASARTTMTTSIPGD